MALLGAYIAWQQWRTNRNKLKMDLFERRYAIYEATMNFVASVITMGKPTQNDTLVFGQAIRGAQFIVGKKLAKYLDKDLYRRATDLQMLDSELDGLHGEGERKANVHEQRVIKDWFHAQYDVLDRRFTPLLRLRH